MGKTLTYKILEQHLKSGQMKPGSEICIGIDYTLTQDSTGTMAYLQKPFTADRLRSVLEGLSLDAQRRSGLREEVGRLLKDGDGQTALGKLKSALAQSPADPQIYQLLADAYEQLGDPQTAEKFRRAAEVFDT